MGPILSAFVATQLLIYLLTLIFSYEELFGATQLDEPIQLSQSEIDQIKQNCERKKSADEVVKDPSVTTISFKPQSGKKDLSKGKEKIQLTEAQRKLQRDAVESLNKEISASMKEDEKKKHKFQSGCGSASPTETPPRYYIAGSFLSDFVQIGQIKCSTETSFISQTVCLLVILAVSIIKVGLMQEGFHFLTLSGPSHLLNNHTMQLDVYEVLTTSPRFLALFTYCFLGQAKFTG